MRKKNFLDFIQSIHAILVFMFATKSKEKVFYITNKMRKKIFCFPMKNFKTMFVQTERYADESTKKNEKDSC
jgi:hypothetical protein